MKKNATHTTQLITEFFFQFVILFSCDFLIFSSISTYTYKSTNVRTNEQQMIRDLRLLFNTMAQRFVGIDRAKLSNNFMRLGTIIVTIIFHIGYI